MTESMNTNPAPGFGPEDKKRQDLLAELVVLRTTDYDAFMDRMFEALNTVFTDAVEDPRSKQEKIRSLDAMIKYFADGDEFEKCQRLTEIKQMVAQYHEEKEKQK